MMYDPGKMESQMVPVKAVVYSQVSTDAQERDGTSLETQERACVEYAESHGMIVVEYIRDTASGFTSDRPGTKMVRPRCYARVSWTLSWPMRWTNSHGTTQPQRGAVR